MHKESNGKSKKYRIDIIVISAILVFALLLLLCMTLLKKEGSTVTVEIDGKVVAEYSLFIDKVYELNGGTNVLVIEGGVAYLSYSSCPDHVCENTGKIKHVGETIICLPNHITITVTGDAKDDPEGGVDLVS